MCSGVSRSRTGQFGLRCHCAANWEPGNLLV
jgi:hypothetical protein